MLAGKLDRRIQIQSGTTVPNSIGEYVPVWITIFSMWASIEYTDTKENFEAAELTAPNEVVFKTRYSTAITEKNRIVYNGHSYDILHIAVINRNEGLKIIARKKDNTEAVAPTSGIVTLTLVITDAPSDTQVFIVTLTGATTIITKYLTQQSPVMLHDIPFGTYAVTQVDVEGYTPVSIVPASVVLSAGSSYAEVVITNEIIIPT